jgi:photosystem II stability/assembly factor-like uncharacterized protein
MIGLRRAVAAVVAAGLVLGTAACSGSAPAPWHLGATSWASPQDGWVLAQRPCGSSVDCEQLLHTTDGGRTWVRTAVLKDAHGTLPQGQLWAADPSDVYQVHQPVMPSYQVDGRDNTEFSTDGGRTWTPEPAAVGTQAGDTFATVALSGHGGTVVRAARAFCADGRNCGDEIQLTSAGSESWRTVVGPFDVGSGPQAHIAWQNDDIGYLAFDGDGDPDGMGPAPKSHQQFRTLDGGKTWSPLPDPCTTGHSPYDLLVAGPGNRVAMSCPSTDALGHRAPLELSTDNGSTWQPWPAPVSDSRVLFSVALTSTAVLAVTEQGLSRSTDGGASWQLVVPTARPDGSIRGLTMCGFDGSDLGELIDRESKDMWTTSDGGLHWSQLTVTVS